MNITEIPNPEEDDNSITTNNLNNNNNNNNHENDINGGNSGRNDSTTGGDVTSDGVVDTNDSPLEDILQEVSSVLNKIIDTAVAAEEERLRLLELERLRLEDLKKFMLVEVWAGTIVPFYEEEITRRIIWPVGLKSLSDALAKSQEAFMFDANPVKIHLDSMILEVERRELAERRRVCRNCIDSVVTQIKTEMGFEPLIVKRRRNNLLHARRKAVSSSIFDMIDIIESRDKKREQRDRIRRGDFNPPPKDDQIAPRVHEHLLNMTWWVEENEFLLIKSQEAPLEKESALRELEERQGEEKLERERSIRARHKEEVKTVAVAIVEEVRKNREREKETLADGTDIVSFNAETKKIEKEKREEEEKRCFEEQEKEMKRLRNEIKEEHAVTFNEVESSYQKTIDDLNKRTKEHQRNRPGESPEQQMLFNRTKLFQTFFHNIMYDESLNLVADNLTKYWDSRSYQAVRCVDGGSWSEMAEFSTLRNNYATHIQALRRRQLARRLAEYRRLRLRSCIFIQKIVRGWERRLKTATYKEEIHLNGICERRFGASASIVRILSDDNPIIEANIAATETLMHMSNCRGGTSLVQDTRIAENYFDKFNNENYYKNREGGHIDISRALRLSALAKTAKSGKNEWASMIEFVGNLDCNEGTRALVIDKGGGESILAMMMRGNSLVKMEGARTIMKLSENGVLREHFTSLEKCRRCLIRMVVECNEYCEKKVGELGEVDFDMVFCQQLCSIETIFVLLRGGQEASLAFGAGGLIECIIGILRNVVVFEEIYKIGKRAIIANVKIGSSTRRYSLLELSCRCFWKLIEEEKNLDRALASRCKTGICVKEMLCCNLVLANRLGCVLVACLAKKNRGKRIFREVNVPICLDKLIVSNNPSVRQAAFVAMEAFAKVGEGDEKKSEVGMNEVGQDIDSNVLLFRTPVGITLGHKGSSIKDTSQYLKKLNIVEPPLHDFRFDSYYHNDEYRSRIKKEEKDDREDLLEHFRKI